MTDNAGGGAFAAVGIAAGVCCGLPLLFAATLSLGVVVGSSLLAVVALAGALVTFDQRRRGARRERAAIDAN